MNRLYILTVTLTIAGTCCGQELATVEDIHCKAQWKGSRIGPQDAHVGLNLHPGESIRCASSGYLLLAVYGASVTIHSEDGWYLYVIPRVRATRLTPEEERREIALQRYARRGGRERSADFGRVSISPQHFDLLFKFAEGGPMLISMRTMTKEIWNGTVNEASGLITSEGARQAVLDYQENGGGPLTLDVSKGDARDEVRYFVLSREADLEIEHQLSMWEAERSSFMRHVGRAFVFDEAGLYEAAAHEYEAALADAPQSSDLILATIREYERSGDENGAKAVRDRLSLR